jgi:outer membrane autotransporter protein
MDCKRTIVANVILSTLVGGSAWADSTHHISDGEHIWDSGLTINGASGDGIRGDGHFHAEISVNGDIDSSANHSGIFISGNASVSFTSTDPTKSFTVTGNRWEGILSESNAMLNIDGMTVKSNNNGSKDNGDGNGLRANSGGKVNITNTAHAEFNKNKEKGIFAYSKNSDEISSISISGREGGGSTLHVNGNGEVGIQSEDNALINISNMSMEVNENVQAGIRVQSQGQVAISGSSGQQLTVTGNGLEDDSSGSGILVKDYSLLNVEGMNIVASKNGPYGIRATDGGVINITGKESNTLTVSENNSADKNRGDGLSADSVGKTGHRSEINIQGMDIHVKDQAYQGIAARNGGLVQIIGSDEANQLDVYNTRMKDIQGDGNDAGKGIHARDSDSETGKQSIIAIKDMNIISNSNEREGVVAAMSGIISIESTSGNNTLVANENKQFHSATLEQWAYGSGLLAHGTSDGSPDEQAAIIIKNMHVEANNNGLYGLYARDGGIISITGDGSQKLTLTGNKSTESASWAAGIAVDGLHENGTSKDPATIFIKDMDVTVSDNGRYGIDVANGGQMAVSSTTGNTLTISGNQTGSAEKKEGIGIHVAGVFDTTQSRLDIFDMDVLIDGSPDAGIKVSDGALVNIVSSKGNHTLKANSNDNHGTQYNEGAGLFAFDSNGDENSAAMLNIAGMNVEANNNGSYGVLSEGGQIHIQGNGSHTLNVDGNGRYGVLAKDGGSIEIAGMKVSGNSLDHTLVGIEREGHISFTHSILTTDNDNLFYAWSDSDTQTSRITLEESVAIGNGSKLAWFDAHNGVLTATHSWLENAIGTSAQAGVTSTVALKNSTWLMRDSSNITHLSMDNALTDMRNKEGYNTLTVNSLTSDNSTYLLNTYFDSPGLTTDKIIVDGGASKGENNVLKVYSTGYATDTREINGYGIQVVNLDNATDKSVDFSLYGGVVDSGAWNYHLYRAVDDNYYLQTDYTPTTTAKVITNIPAVQLSIIKSGLNEFRHRITELREQDIFQPNEVWVRSWGKHLKIDDTIDSKMNLYGIELGYDKEIYENEENKYYAGIMVGYMYADNIKHHNAGYPDGSASANTPGVGLYGVWDNSDGWYSYGTLRYFWSKMKAQNYTSAGEKITFNPDRNYFAATVELGKQFEEIIDEKSKWIFEPKAELGYAYSASKSFKTNMNADVRYGKSDSFTTRAALLLGYNSEAESGSIYEPFVEVGVNQEWLGKTDVTYAGGRFKSDQQGAGFDLSVGLRARTNENWSFIGNLGYEKGEVTQGFGAQLGVRYSW